MTDRIKASFDSIRAEEKLKSDTTRYLQMEIAKRNQRRAFTARRYAAAFAAVLILAISGVFAHTAYYTPAAYVDVDVNPSIALTLNGFGRVIDTHAYYGDGDEAIQNLSLMHKRYKDAFALFMAAITAQGYFQDGALVSVTLQTDDANREKAMLAGLQADMDSYMVGHHQTAQLDVFPVSRDTRNHSHEQGISPAKYLAIQALIAVDPTATVAECRNHSISEIKQLTQAHGTAYENGHESNQGNNEKGGNHGNGHGHGGH